MTDSSRWKPAQARLRARSNLRDGIGDIYAWMEENFDNRYAAESLRFRVLDVIDGSRKIALEAAGDPVTQFLRRESGVVPNDRNHGDIDVGEDIHGHAQDDHRPQYEEQQ